MALFLSAGLGLGLLGGLGVLLACVAEQCGSVPLHLLRFGQDVVVFLDLPGDGGEFTQLVVQGVQFTGQLGVVRPQGGAFGLGAGAFFAA